MAIGQQEYVFQQPRSDLITAGIYLLCVPVAWVAYPYFLGAARLRTVWFALVTAAVAVWLVLGVLRLRRSWSGPHPALAPGGVRLPRSYRGPIAVAWSQIRLVWIETRYGSRSLAVLLRGDRLGKVRYLPLPEDPTSTDELGELIDSLSGGELQLAESGPEDDGIGLPRGSRVSPERQRRPPWRTPPLRLLPVSLALLALVVPVVFALPPLWNQPWWPGGHRALSAPDPCTQLTRDVPADLFEGAGTGHITRNSQGFTTCTVTDGTTSVELTYSVHTATFGSSIQKAEKYAETAVPAVTMQKLPLGDTAWIAGKSPDDGMIYMGASQLLVARAGNVVVTLSYTGSGDPNVVRPALVTIGTRAVKAIQFS